MRREFTINFAQFSVINQTGGESPRPSIKIWICHLSCWTKQRISNRTNIKCVKRDSSATASEWQSGGQGFSPKTSTLLSAFADISPVRGITRPYNGAPSRRPLRSYCILCVGNVIARSVNYPQKPQFIFVPNNKTDEACSLVRFLL